MDGELLAAQVAALVESVTKLDGRVDAHDELLTQCQSLLNDVNDHLKSTITMDQVTAHLATLEAERQIATEERLKAEAEALQAQAEAAEAEAELQAAVFAEAEPEEPETPALEVLEAEPIEEPKPKPEKRTSPLFLIGM